MDIIKTERLLKALANRRRLALLKQLARTKEMTVAELAGAIKLSFKSTSKHLIILSQAELVERRQENLNVLYRLAKPLPPILRVVLNYL